jgi:hypothetical protein
VNRAPGGSKMTPGGLSKSHNQMTLKRTYLGPKGRETHVLWASYVLVTPGISSHSENIDITCKILVRLYKRCELKEKAYLWPKRHREVSFKPVVDGHEPRAMMVTGVTNVTYGVINVHQ